ncbi:lysophospholipid acyltransferase family protein [Orbaceae bacterium ESL0721]|nr:lysophospholipid acyltransferase family protein [Orbaceae bacterium ESL0721]
MANRNTIIKKISYGWRIIATAIGFILFGLGGLLIISIFWFTCLRLFIWNPLLRNKVAKRSVCYSFKFFLWIIKILGIIDYQFIGQEKLSTLKSTLIVVNHPSLLDYVLLASVIPETSCIVKETLLKNFFIGGIIKTVGYIPNTKADKLLNLCKQKFQRNNPIIIFPEGTRSTPNKPLSFQRGAANIALRCQTDIQMIHINCNPPFLLKGQKWYQVAKSRAKFIVTVGNKIAISDFSHEHLTVGSRRLTQYLESCFNQHLSLNPINNK